MVMLIQLRYFYDSLNIVLILAPGVSPLPNIFCMGGLKNFQCWQKGRTYNFSIFMVGVTKFFQGCLRIFGK